MVLKEDGTKWACQSCLKGHRVSGCNHTDRELILVPKKGRPVTQCQHCRQERKKRSAHVSCDCAAVDKPHHPKEKCIHLREAEEKAKAAGFRDAHAEKDPAHLVRVAEEQGCCCHHGGTCTCALLMKDPNDGSAPHGPAVKPKLEKATSEGAITVFHNGHHKPVHRKNHAAHECGMPYKIPISRHHTDNIVSAAARRSVDNLKLDVNQAQKLMPFVALTGDAVNHDRRKSKSEQHSPTVPAMMEAGNGCNLPAFGNTDFDMLSQTQTNQSVRSAATDGFGFPTFDSASAMADGSYDPWSTYPSAEAAMPNNNPFGVWPSSTDGTSMGQPALTAASSGTTSEIDEIPHVEDAWDFGMPSIQEDPCLEFSSLLSRNSPQANRRSLPPDMFSSIDFAVPNNNNEWQMPVQDLNATNPGKAQPPQARQASSFDSTWQVSDAQQPMMSAYRQLAGLPTTSRPQSRSLGTVTAPNDDIMKQLFPEIDIDGSMFGSITNPMPTSNPPSAQMDFGPMDETSNGFVSQPWTDGSLSIPSDVITSPFTVEQDFSNPHFTGNWSQ